MVAAAVAAAALSCHPEPGLGSLTYTRSGQQHVVDLATCQDRVLRPSSMKPSPNVSPDGRFVATVVVSRQGTRGTNAIVVRNRKTGATRTVYLVHESYSKIPAGSPGPIVLNRWSGDGRWLFFAIDPQGSNSIASDGLMLQVVSARGGRPHRVAMTLAYPDYLAWCHGRLFLTGGGNRLVTTNKRLLVASPPNWRARLLIRAPKRAWGSLACAPDGGSLVVQSQTHSEDYTFSATRWQLWRVGLDGSERQLTSPPPKFADDSPRFSHDGRAIFFVRSRRGIGNLFVLRGERVTGPLLPLGYVLGYYGHRDWRFR